MKSGVSAARGTYIDEDTGGRAASSEDEPELGGLFVTEVHQHLPPAVLCPLGAQGEHNRSERTQQVRANIQSASRPLSAGSTG